MCGVMCVHAVAAAAVWKCACMCVGACGGGWEHETNDGGLQRAS